VELLVFLLTVAGGGLVVGALARLAIPGRDPMSLWMTILLGVVGSFLGGLVAGALFGQDAYGVAFPFAVGGASLLLGLHRSFLQRRPLFGPGAGRVSRGPGRKQRDHG
jgi:uncharacterized membrane protein YeaQ/YmgE (transglycosylase-associated protein family)